MMLWGYWGGRAAGTDLPLGTWPGPLEAQQGPGFLELLISLPEAFFLTGKLHIDSAHPGSLGGLDSNVKAAVEWGGTRCYKESPASWQPQSLF